MVSIAVPVKLANVLNPSCGGNVMIVTVEELKTDIEGVLSRLSDPDDAVEFEANGQIWQIVSTAPKGKLRNLIPRPDIIVGDPEDLVHIDWSEYWNADLP
ncbi:MAG TPA: hypothetical protein VK137_01695 [Planctomycetaceae bacterium]|nr:hypothetical protein [Planctomycetaceae bacterium]